MTPKALRSGSPNLHHKHTKKDIYGACKMYRERGQYIDEQAMSTLAKERKQPNKTKGVCLPTGKAYD